DSTSAQGDKNSTLLKEVRFKLNRLQSHERARHTDEVQGTRANLNYLDQLAKFHKQHGTNLNRFPSVDKRPLDLYKLKKAVERKGGFEKVCKLKKWAEVGRDLGYSGKIMSSLSTSLKNSYQKLLNPYEEYLRIAKPGVHQQLELENGGPLTPSPGPSLIKKQHQHTPSSLREEAPAIRASAALNATIQSRDDLDVSTPASESFRPLASSGFTAVNAGGFTPVNVPQRSSGFVAVNAVNGVHHDADHSHSTPQRSVDTPSTSVNNTPSFQSTNGHAVSHNKRQLSSEADADANVDSDATGRRSKRLKKEAAPTVAGSHMTQPRTSTSRLQAPKERAIDKAGEQCETCGKADDPSSLLLCDSCDSGYHKQCLEPPLKSTPDYDWHCPRCLVGTGEFGFEEGGVYSLKQFQEKAHNFKENYFMPKMPFDPVLNCKRPVTEDDVEREFWRLVESITETVEVEYGADIHSTTHGSGFPTVERHPRDPYSTDPWNLNILPLHPESLFRHIKSDISGMTVPWLYVGMCFSTFCWHNEDHYTYSANYQHFGATKTWYGIPGEDAAKFEAAMHAAVPELFETQPDLLFQLVTLMQPEKLKQAGLRVYALDQRAGQFVITFPQAYHAGFNHGFNLNEAVNFAPSDWEPFGEAGVERLQAYRRQPCFSHDELLLTAAARDTSIKTARWLAPALTRMVDRYSATCDRFLRIPSDHTDIEGGGPGHAGEDATHGYTGARYSAANILPMKADLEEDDYICCFCKTYSYLSRYVCEKSSKVMCLEHAGAFECCESSEEDRYSGASGAHILYERMTILDLNNIVTRVADKSRVPERWAEKVDSLLDDDPTPPLKSLRSLLAEGERIPYDLPQLDDLRKFVERCNEWVEEATNYISRKQQNRRKNEKAWRKGNSTRVAEMEERDRELRKVENIKKLLAAADDIGFDCPEIVTLRERAAAIEQFQRDAQEALRTITRKTTQEFEDLVELGKGFNVDIPEVDQLEKLVQRLKWNDSARDRRTKFQTLKDVGDFVQQGLDLGVPETDHNLVFFRELKAQGEVWEAKAKELMAVENVHYQQLDALSKQAATLPVTPETLAAVDAILKKQREAQEQIISLYERSKNPDFRQRPKYKEVKDVMEALNELNSKPTGTIDLEKEQKRHEDWMRRGKKLFGKANAPLHILHAHMQTVEARNEACFDLRDKPRMPVEPSSREHTPEESRGQDESLSNRDVFCICRKPEAGMMIECELCHEWYHGKCLKIARGKVKEDDKYTCPICDYRVKIPRDAARPKLEDLQAWQDELMGLPFQPEEEETLANIVDHAQAFREYMRPYVNPVMATPDEVTAQRFYLRKIEGADILLAFESNFLRQELHKWAPVALEPPPVIEASHSTRKPRPTKQQKVMASLGITNPEDIPVHLRTKAHTYKQRNKSGDVHAKPPHPLQPARGDLDGSHTPASLPHSTSTGEPPTHNDNLPQPHGQHTPSFSYDGHPMVTTSYRDSPMFATTAHNPFSHNPITLGSPNYGSASPRNLDPALFGNPPSFGRDQVGSPMGNAFSSSSQGVMDSMFADIVNHEDALGGSHAHDALVVSHEAEVDSQALADQFLNN
ncbi:hypothetical protein B0A49_12633, partial [Cryomyces minteri]